jgi:nitroreductase
MVIIMWHGGVEMEVFEAVKKRRSVRKFKEKDIPPEVLQKLLEAARLAPSATNRQPWKFIVVKEERRRKELAEAAHRQWFIAEAPVIIAGVALEPERVMSNEVPAYPVDLAIALEHIVLQAVEEGLGTCWICAFDQERVKEILRVPRNLKVVALLPVGYPGESPSPRPRKPLSEITSTETF